ncbi:hypothetical protein Ahy_A06g028062 [Arachis hypogaea]|uniref:Uncharacterized protein n=1 Tax=Arachis hypogaea TaxID=3818 RepID=A0A445CQA4_ARAHY|nr:hypothetical protein Ahy_A06g028062 [Arachis hypogaea]
MEEAFPFSSLEHATSFARDLWFNILPMQSWLNTFSAHRHIGDAITIVHRDIRTVRCHIWNLFKFMQARNENSLNVELEIASREEFTLIERGLAREKIQEILEETGEIVQDSMLEEDVVPNSSHEVVSKGHKPSILIFDLNKTPEENDIR